MTTFYINPLNGNDVNSGLAWGSAWKTIKGAASSLISPNDIIKVAKSPDPVSLGNVAWTNLSKTVTIPSGLVSNVFLCESSWTASTYVTYTLTTSYRKEGTYCGQFNINTSFTTGKVSYKALGASYDFSAYQKLTFWFRTSAAIAENVFKICLCSDTFGAVIVDEFILPAIESASVGMMIPFVIDKGSALGSAIQSVAIYAITDPGGLFIYIDDILACNDFSLCSLISKNSLATGGVEAWYPIQSINGTTLLIDNAVGTIATAGQGYYGVTETVTSYYRNCFRCTTTTDCAIQDSGTSGNLIEFQGGYDTSSGNQNGETFFDVGSGIGSGLDLASKNYVLLNRLNMVRSGIGLNLNATNYCNITAHTIAGSSSIGIELYNSNGNVLSIKNSVNNGSFGIDFAGSLGNKNNRISVDFIGNSLNSGVNSYYLYNNKLTFGDIVNSASTNIVLNDSTFNNIIKLNNSKKSIGYGLTFGNLSKDNVVIGATFSDNTSGSINYPTKGNNHLIACTLSDTTKTTGHVVYADARLSSKNQDGTTTSYIYTDGTSGIKTQNTVRHTESDIAWELPVTSANRSVDFPLTLPILQLAVNGGSQVTVSCWFRRTNTAAIAGLLCKGLQISGVDSDVSSLMTVDIDTWEQVSINFTPTEQGVVEILAFAYGGTTYSVYIDDVDYSQA